jgi:hypothetical protein
MQFCASANAEPQDVVEVAAEAEVGVEEDAPTRPDDEQSNEGEVEKPIKDLTIDERFAKFADEIEKEMERRELEGNKSLQIVRQIQDEQRTAYRDSHEEIKSLTAKKQTRETRDAINEAVKRKRLAGARLNELEQRAVLLVSASTGRDNNDLMQKVSRFASDLSREDRSKWQRNSDMQRRYSQLMQKIMTARHRHYPGQQGFTDLTAGLVGEEIELDKVRYPDHAGAQDGTIQKVRPALNRILKLSWMGNRIIVDAAHWDELFAGRSPEDLQNDVDNILKQNDVTMPNADQNGMPFNRGMNSPNVARLFDLLRSEFGNVGSRSSSGGALVNSSFSSVEAASELELKPGTFRFEFRERNFPRRLVMLEQNSNGTVSVTLYGEVVLRMQQKEDGSISVVETVGNQLIHREAESLGKLYLEEPEFIEERLFPLLHHVSIIPPASRFDPRIVNRVVDRLNILMEIEDIEAINKLISDLDHDDFKIRQAATKRLEAKADHYREILIAAANQDGASFETRSRIKYLLDQSSLETADSDSLINTLRLMENPEYLAIMMQQLQEEDFQPVGKRLEELTGINHGADVDAWREWLASSANDELIQSN